MVGKVVVHGDAAHRAARLHAAFDVLKAAQRGGCTCRVDTQVLRCGDGGQRIELVVHAGQAPAHMACALTPVQHIKVMRWAIGVEVAHR